ncbi:hypothetical protein QF002_007329 [Paraburkholderia youngii]
MRLRVCHVCRSPVRTGGRCTWPAGRRGARPVCSGNTIVAEAVALSRVVNAKAPQPRAAARTLRGAATVTCRACPCHLEGCSPSGEHTASGPVRRHPLASRTEVGHACAHMRAGMRVAAVRVREVVMPETEVYKFQYTRRQGLQRTYSSQYSAAGIGRMFLRGLGPLRRCIQREWTGFPPDRKDDGGSGG